MIQNPFPARSTFVRAMTIIAVLLDATALGALSPLSHAVADQPSAPTVRSGLSYATSNRSTDSENLAFETQASETRVFSQDLILRGASARSSFFVDTTPANLPHAEADAPANHAKMSAHAPTYKPAVLVLRGLISELVDLSHSTLSVTVDHRPQRSAWLTELTQHTPIRRWRNPAAHHGQKSSSALTHGKTSYRHPRAFELRISLAALPAGFHRIDLHTRLVIAEDPCLERYRQEAWINISHNETKMLMAPSVSSPAPRVVFASLKRRLRSIQGPVRIDVPRPIRGTVLAAYLELDSFIRTLGKRPSLLSRPIDARVEPRGMSRSNTMAPHLALLVDEPTFGPPSTLAHALTKSPNKHTAAITADSRTITILLRSTRDTHRAVQRILRDDTRVHCRFGSACILDLKQSESPKSTPHGVRNTDKNETHRATEGPPSTLISLSDIGFPKGWTASGTGAHTLRFSWQKPKHWNIHRRPQVALTLRWPNDPNWIADQSFLSLRMNDVPLGTWHFISSNTSSEDTARPSGRQEKVLKVWIPQELWEETNWAFQVDLNLASKRQHQCTRSTDLSHWATLSPQSHLRIERREYRGGIANFYEKLNGTLPRIVLDGSLTAAQAELLGHTVFPFANRDGDHKNNHADDRDWQVTETLPGRKSRTAKDLSPVFRVTPCRSSTRSCKDVPVPFMHQRPQGELRCVDEGTASRCSTLRLLLADESLRTPRNETSADAGSDLSMHALRDALPTAPPIYDSLNVASTTLRDRQWRPGAALSPREQGVIEVRPQPTNSTAPRAKSDWEEQVEWLDRTWLTIVLACGTLFTLAMAYRRFRDPHARRLGTMPQPSKPSSKQLAIAILLFDLILAVVLWLFFRHRDFLF